MLHFDSWILKDSKSTREKTDTYLKGKGLDLILEIELADFLLMLPNVPAPP